jgi:hypothetical protein
MGWPGEQLLIKMWESLEKIGIGLASPMQIKREGRARAEVRRFDLLMDAKVRGELDDVQGGRMMLDRRGRLLPAHTNAEQRAEPTLIPQGSDTSKFVDAALRMKALEASRQLLNLRQTAIYAEEEAERIGDRPVSDDPVDPDWLARWHDGAQNVSGEELQRIWARVLAGEIQNPGTYSLRTVEFLRTLSKHDAELIAEAARFRIERCLFTGAKFQGVLFFGGNLLPSFGMNIDKLLELETLGIITGVETQLSWTFDKRHNPSVQDRLSIALRCHNRAITIDHENPNTIIGLRGYKVTRTGMEVMSLGLFEPHPEYTLAIAREIKDHHPGTQVSVGDVVELPTGGYEVTNRTEIGAPIQAAVVDSAASAAAQ